MANWTNEPTVGRCIRVFFLIDDTHFFLIDNTHKLIISQTGTCWDNEQESL